MARYINADGFIKNMSDIRESVMQKHKLGSSDSTIDGYDADLLRAIGFAGQLVSEYPTADVRPNVKGEWVKDELGTTVCSNCKNPRRDNRIKHIAFCNSCGADMRKKGEE